MYSVNFVDMLIPDVNEVMIVLPIHFLLFMLQAAVSGLQNQPIINAVIDGDDIIYRDYVDISIAVGTPKVCSSFPCLGSFLFVVKEPNGELQTDNRKGTMIPPSFSIDSLHYFRPPLALLLNPREA